MFLKKVGGPRTVTLPDGTVLSRADLPPADTRRWVTGRKATVVQAVRLGLIAEHEALDRYGLSAEEFALWCTAVDLHGQAGLRVTRIQSYRRNPA